MAVFEERVMLDCLGKLRIKRVGIERVDEVMRRNKYDGRVGRNGRMSDDDGWNGLIGWMDGRSDDVLECGWFC